MASRCSAPSSSSSGSTDQPRAGVDGEVAMKLSPVQLEQFTHDGYLVIEDAVEPPLLEPLRAAAGRVTQKTRSGEWPHNGDAGDGDIWGVNHLLHPNLG